MSKESVDKPPTRSKDALDTDLAARAVQRGLITSAQLKEALAEQARDLADRKEGVRPLGVILVAKKYLTPAQLQELILASLSPTSELARTAPFGKYQLVRELGRGGMGVVYEALDTGLGRRVAIKTMIVNPAADPKDAKLDEERFLREARLSASLAKHPHIVGVYEVGVVQGKRYLAMELIDGKPMSEWWSGPSVTMKQEIELLRAAALAVHHAHEHDVIHRDLKPANILVDQKNEPHITDFGLAKMVGENLSVSLTGAGMVVGTPAYISPEQAQGLKSTDRRTDVYALGVILFEIVTGRHPFQGQTAMEILMKASKNPVPSASSLMQVRLDPEQAKGLDDICQKALAKKASDRYRDAATFAADLARWLEGETVHAVVPTRRMIRPAPRNWTALAAVAGVLLLALLIYLLRSSPAPDSGDDHRRKAAAEEEKKKLAADRQAAEARARKAESELTALKGNVLTAKELKSAHALQPGLIGEYYGGSNFEIPSLCRIDPLVSFQWNWGQQAWPDAPLEYCTMRWRGYLKVPDTAQYTLQVICNDGLRLFVDEVEIFSRWVPQGGVVETDVRTLEKGYHSLLLECLKAPGKGGIAFTCKKVNEATEAALSHDPALFVPLSQKPTVDHVDQKSLPGAQEAEKLQILEAGPDSTVILPWGRGKGFLLWGKTAVGDRLKFQFNSPESGERTLILALGRSKNSGIVRIAVNGREVAKDLDLHAPQNHFLEVEFKKVLLRKGANELEFTMTGSNPAAAEWRKGDGVYKMSFDYLQIR